MAVKVVFLDRDGVINEFPGHGDYVTTFKQFKFINGSREAIGRLTEAGFKIYIISNQACVGKGLLKKEKLEQITMRLIDGIAQVGGKVDGVFYCTHRPDAGCDCRKPGIGNIKRALELAGTSLAKVKGCYFVGDAKSDCQAAKNAGLQSIMVLTGKETSKEVHAWDVKPTHIVKDLSAAVDVILKLK